MATLTATITFLDAYRLLVATNMLPAGPMRDAALQAQAQALGPVLLVMLTAVGRIQAVAADPVLAPMLATSNLDVPLLNVATAANAMVLSNTARANARALLTWLHANLNIPVLLQSLTATVLAADDAFSNAGAAAAQLVHCHAAGAAATAGAAACDNVMHAANKLAAANAGLAATPQRR